jgi:serine/threonine protein kinase
MPLGGLIRVMTEVLSALGAAHAIGIVHRDLKPDNVLITAEGHAKVLDFGIAKLAPELQPQQSPRTRTGALLGTPQYMAPEQISGSGGVDPRTDLYAAGVVLYELATGRLPFVGETLFDLMRAHLEQPPPPPRSVRPDLPAALEHVILTALAKRPSDRFASAAAMTQALHQASAGLPAEQWRSLSLRSPASGAPDPVRSGPPSAPSGAEGPLAYRKTRPVGPAPTVDGTGRIGLIVGAVVVAAVAVAVTLFVIAHRGASSPATLAVSSPAAGSATPGSTGSGAGSGSSNAPPPATPSGSDAESPPTPATTAPPAKPPPAVDPSVPSVTPSGHTGSRRDHADGAPAAPANAGPTIVGGGSAADHGVVVGRNVTTGPNVVIGGGSPTAASSPTGGGSPTAASSLSPAPPAPREEIVRSADYDPRRFDPVAYLPRAQRLARELLPDAQLTTFEFDPVFSDGHVDLTVEGRDRSYDFRSPERSAFPAGRPRNLPFVRKCLVVIELTPTTVSARVSSSRACDERLIRAPRCGLASVWKQALAKGTAGDLVARIGWLFDESWFFDLDLAGKGGGVSSFADRCP